MLHRAWASVKHSHRPSSLQVIFKSAKLLVAMLIRATVFKKPNKRIDYYCGIMLSLGLIGFMCVNLFKSLQQGLL
jgi:hypothetical protein